MLGLYIETLEERRLLAFGLMADLNTSTPSSDPSVVRVAGGVGYFTATTSATGRELWRTDGTDQGTQLVYETVPGSSSQSLTLLQPLGTRMLFTDVTNRLWITDGTAAGTNTIVTLNGAPFGSAAANGLVF